VESEEDLDDQEKQLERIKREDNGKKRGGDTYGTTRESSLVSLSMECAASLGSELTPISLLFVTQLWKLVEGSQRKKRKTTRNSKQLGGAGGASAYSSKLLLDLPFDLFVEVNFSLFRPHFARN